MMNLSKDFMRKIWHKLLFANALVAAVIIYIWYHLKEGQQGIKIHTVSQGMNTGFLDYFFESNGDASTIKWAQFVNSEEELTKAIINPHVMVVSGTVQSTRKVSPGTYLVMKNTQFPLEEWLFKAAARRKAVMVRFSDIETIKLVLDILEDIVTKMPPLWLHVDVLNNGKIQNGKPLSEAIEPKFSGVTVSFGWYHQTSAPLSWLDVIHMNDIILAMEDTNNRHVVTLHAATLDNGGLSKILWLYGVTDTQLFVYASQDDRFSLHTIYFLSGELPYNSLYLDIPEAIMTHKTYKENRILAHKSQTMDFTIQIDSWRAMITDSGGSKVEITNNAIIMTGSEANLLCSDEELLIDPKQGLGVDSLTLDCEFEIVLKNSTLDKTPDYAVLIHARSEITSQEKGGQMQIAIVSDIICSVSMNGSIQITRKNSSGQNIFSTSFIKIPKYASYCFSVEITINDKHVAMHIDVLDFCGLLTARKVLDSKSIELDMSKVTHNLATSTLFPFNIALNSPNVYLAITKLAAKKIEQ